MRATEAFEMSTKNKKTADEDSLRQILKDIKYEAEKGRFELRLDYIPSREVVIALENLGYKCHYLPLSIVVNAHKAQMIYSITWKIS